MSRIVYENKCVEILKNGWNLTDCCKENKHFICKRPKGELFSWELDIKNDGEVPIVPGTTKAQVKFDPLTA